jgi:hypothetical protein
MRMRAVLVVGLSILSAWPLRAVERLTITVSPAVALAPATVQVRAAVDASAENRAIQIVAESSGFYRSSEIPLDGAEAPRTTIVEFRGLPGGTYTISAVLIRTNGRAIASRGLRVVGRGSEE